MAGKYLKVLNAANIKRKEEIEKQNGRHSYASSAMQNVSSMHACGIVSALHDNVNYA